jgi:hypothetical protein
MPTWPSQPVIFEINTWAWIDELRRKSGRPLTLETVPQDELERLAALGFDGLWLMGVWQRSPGSRQVASGIDALQKEYRRALPDLRPDDIVGSPYAIYDYQVDEQMGGDAALAALRKRLEKLGLGLILDFVPNHLALDHPWTREHPERLLQGRPAQLEKAPDNYFRAHGQVYAHGRDPYFPGWSDTVQLDYRRPETRRAIMDLLLSVSQRCDGLRCDMAMLLTHDVFLRTWGGSFDPPGMEFWPEAIDQVKAAHPGFLMMAEVYWDMEYELQQMGFDYCYDKRLYDRLVKGQVAAIRDHLALASREYLSRLVHFIENHDEPRAAATFGVQRSRAAAVAALAAPGARLIHEGQLTGRRRKLPVQLGRRLEEPIEPELLSFYRALLEALRHPIFHEGQWKLLSTQEATPGDESHRNLVISCWELGAESRIAVANLSTERAQTIVPIDRPGMAGRTWELYDLLGANRFLRDGAELGRRGLDLDLPGYGYHLFRLAEL